MLTRIHCVAGLADYPDELMAEDRPGLESRSPAVEGKEIGTADGGRPHFDDRVGRLLDTRLGDLLDPDVLRAR